MTDADLIAKKLAQIETYLHELRTLARPADVRSDLREERFVAHTLQLAIQTVIDVAAHIVADDRLGEPQSQRDLFDLLARHGWISSEQALDLQRMVGFRNLLVHEYARLDLDVLREVAEQRLDDFTDFVASIRQRMV